MGARPSLGEGVSLDWKGREEGSRWAHCLASGASPLAGRARREGAGGRGLASGLSPGRKGRGEGTAETVVHPPQLSESLLTPPLLPFPLLLLLAAQLVGS